MAETTTVGKFVSQKISKIRWQPTLRQVLQQSSIFATGSWDNGENNKLSLWQLEKGLNYDNVEGSELSGLEGEPCLLCDADHTGDITDLVYMSQELLMVSSSSGAVSLYKHHTNSQTLSVSHQWQSLHHHQTSVSCPCTGIALKGDDLFVSVGEDGRICVVNTEHRKPARVIEKADSCTQNAVTFLKQSEVATVNTIGQLKVWDIRQSSEQPAKVFLLTGERVPLHCLDKHPTQPHIVATGGQDGTLYIWDMRQDKFPVTLLTAHSADMWELKFHPSHPDNLFSCSEDGSLWHWDRSGASVTPDLANLLPHKDSSRNLSTQSFSTSLMPATAPVKTTGAGSAWLSSETSRQGLEITDLLPGNAMPVNSLDITDRTVACGSDSEQIFILQNRVIK